jgi:hypothetical protein
VGRAERRDGALVSELRLAGLPPSLRELVAVEEPEDAADENQHDFIERPWNGQKPEGPTPSDWFGYATVSKDELYCSNRLRAEEARPAHALSVGTRKAGAA